MRYTIRRVSYMPKLYHNSDERRLVKAYCLNNGLFVCKIPMSKQFRISHITGLVLPKYYKTRKDALTDLVKLQVLDWTTYEENRDALIALYREVTK